MSDTYPQYRSSSGWNALLPPRSPKPALAGDERADVVIVGAGFTGLACARRWQALQPDARIVVVDASEVGEGNPGRNSGFLLEIALADDADASSRERMAQCNRLTREAMQSIVADVEASPEPIDLSRAGTYRAAGGEIGMQALEKYEAFLKAADLPYRRLDQAELRAELGTDFYRAGLYSPDCYLAQPAAVIRAIAAQLPESVALYENTPVTVIHCSGTGWRVQARGSELSCQKLVLANNSFARNLGIAKSRLAAVYTYAGITPVLDEALLDELGSNSNWGVLPMHRLGSTLRRTADGRLLIRSLHDYESEGDPAQVERALLDRLGRRFPQLKGQRFEQCWGGAVGFTYNSAPLWGEQAPGLYVSCGCNGGGTVKGTLFGRLLAELANGEAVPDVAQLFGAPTWMPPEPARGIGFRIKAALESRQGSSEL
jgi:glycine/D-amino acid oxidase-like deaminating enzyme